MDSILTDVLNLSMNNMMAGLHTALPGRIVAYDYTKQKAQVKPMISKKYRDGRTESLPVIVNVPVIFPRSSGASLTFPVNNGDYVLLIFSERSMENWLALGGEQEPGDTRKYDLTDAIAIPGLYPFSVLSIADNNTDVLLKYKNTEFRIQENGNINIISPLVNIVGDVNVTGDVVASGISLVTHIHSGVVPGGGTTGQPVP